MALYAAHFARYLFPPIIIPYLALLFQIAAARIKYGTQEVLTLGNLNAQRDRGYTPEYVQGVRQIKCYGCLDHLNSAVRANMDSGLCDLLRVRLLEVGLLKA